jgi:hypothetical protein
MIPLGVKTSGFNIFEAKNASLIQGRRIFRLFASIHRLSPNQGNVFSRQKCQIRIPSMFLPLEGSFLEKNFETFLQWMSPYCVVASTFPNFMGTILYFKIEKKTYFSKPERDHQITKCYQHKRYYKLNHEYDCS